MTDVASHSNPMPPTAVADPLTIGTQGSFAVGGIVTANDGVFDPRQPTDPARQTLHGDHATVSYQIPVDPRPLPLVFWHGYLVAGSTWDTTPDGREGFRTMFLRRRFSVYILDSLAVVMPARPPPPPRSTPRRTNSGSSTGSGSAPGPTSTLTSSSLGIRKP
jgi:hypothetical protein